MIKYSILCLLLSLSLTNCSSDSEKEIDGKSIYDNYQVEGGFLLRSLSDNKVYVYNSNYCQKEFLPASTFKIVSSIIALENGIANDKNYAMPWDSTNRALPIWNQDHNLESAFASSCVPCFQKMVGEIGLSKMQEGVQQLNYGKMDIQANNLTTFWLTGRSTITPYEQLDFLTKLYRQTYPLKPSTYYNLQQMMVLATSPEGVVMKGKSGFAIENGIKIGWLVGFVERPDGENFVFVNQITSPVGKLSDEKFLQARKKIVGDILAQMKVI